MDKIGKILEANLSDKSNLPDWYQERLKICGGCPLNSVNYNTQTIPEKVRFGSLATLNTGKPFCWECGCKITAKASLPESECGGKPRRWKSIMEGETVLDIEQLEYVVENKSPDKVQMTYRNGEFELDFGDLEYLEDTKIKVLVTPKTEEDFINLRLASECGCTTFDVERDGKSLILSLEYDTKREGEFKKLVTLGYTSNKERKIRIRIKGNVSNDEL
jgi:hypothetical protein